MLPPPRRHVIVVNAEGIYDAYVYVPYCVCGKWKGIISLPTPELAYNEGKQHHLDYIEKFGETRK